MFLDLALFDQEILRSWTTLYLIKSSSRLGGIVQIRRTYNSEFHGQQ